MKALVIGASGFLGNALLEQGRIHSHEVTGTFYTYELPGLTKLDMTRPEAITAYLKQVRPEYVLLPAAIPNVELCETHPEETWRVNVDAVDTIARACLDVGAQLVYFSSDYVFDGTAGPYRESDQPNPLSRYGQQKLAAERLVIDILPGQHLILRITVVYGWEERGKNFFQRLLSNLQTGINTRVPIDQTGNPTEVTDLADAVWSLVDQHVQGLYHLAGPDLVSRYDFALKVAQVFGRDPTLIIPVTTPDLQQAAPRPLQAGMISQQAETRIGRRMRGIEASLTLLKAHKPQGI